MPNHSITSADRIDLDLTKLPSGALCATEDATLWDPDKLPGETRGDRRARHAIAARYCRRCPLRDDCRVRITDPGDPVDADDPALGEDAPPPDPATADVRARVGAMAAVLNPPGQQDRAAWEQLRRRQEDAADAERERELAAHRRGADDEHAGWDAEALLAGARWQQATPLPARIAAMTVLRRRGWSAEQIGAHLHVEPRSVTRFCSKHRVPAFEPRPAGDGGVRRSYLGRDARRLADQLGRLSPTGTDGWNPNRSHADRRAAA